MTRPSLSTLDRARRDVGTFAEVLVGAPLWSHQLDLARSPARYRVVCAGRQVGKSRALSIVALHQAFSSPGSLVLLVSAGDVAAKRLLDDVSGLAMASPLLAGAVVDESQSLIVLSNGSTVRSVPASSRQIRGWPVDLLIVDEAGFIDPEIWRAAEPSIIARPGSRVVLSSSPWGGADHFFRQLWQRGMTGADSLVAGFHWPSSLSPLVDAGLLDQIRERETAAYFAREYLAEWSETSGAYFSQSELDGAVVDAALVAPGEVGGDVPAVAGVDWGFANDASTLVVITGARQVADVSGPRPRYRVAWLGEWFRTLYSDVIDEIVAAGPGVQGRGYVFRQVVSELNGVGAMPTQELQAMFAQSGVYVPVEGVHTTQSGKEDWFGFTKLCLQQGRLELPRHPGLLRQLAALEFVQSDAGGSRIAVPERSGHDDLAMGLALAMSALMGDDTGLGALAPPEPAGRRRLSREVDFMREPM